MQEKMPQRKQIRLKEYDYSQEGYYFITICTQNRECILSRIIEEKKQNKRHVGVGVLDDPQKENMQKHSMQKYVGVDAHIDPQKENMQKHSMQKYVGVDAHIDPQKENVKIKLLKPGRIVEKYINNYNKNFDNIKIHDYVIMPNHIHLIMELINRVDVGIAPYNT